MGTSIKQWDKAGPEEWPLEEWREAGNPDSPKQRGGGNGLPVSGAGAAKCCSGEGGAAIRDVLLGADKPPRGEPPSEDGRGMIQEPHLRAWKGISPGVY
ncbi:hypothetical protein NDU88_007055 [Pleurodeles waltl]|uniref:Uncharacterized protein n=1 Tax=Pleurodeles waltl TaxID=8319 RepID=A0AAV7VPL6_PLEWA|nr:hypothetical protein NDU88_007055 [Pleurodeles waltl]